MPSTHPLDVSASGERAILVRREFDAPPALVYQAYTKPEYVQRWLGVFGDWRWAGCEMDVRVGGTFRWTWAGGDGGPFTIAGAFLEVAPGKRLVMTQTYEGMEDYGEMLVTVTFATTDRGTLIEELVEYPTQEARDADITQMPSGLEPGFKNLDALLATLA